jgi:hypothetical protein
MSEVAMQKRASDDAGHCGVTNRLRLQNEPDWDQEGEGEGDGDEPDAI